MAIVQISKITQRAGNLVDLPQLDNGEFGWATDTNRLFIGKTGNVYADENIEVLTSYSNINFSQITGSDGGNFNISAAQNGQILTYVSSTDTWENYSGNASQFGGTKLQLGSVSNISMTGGAIGYVLETDGLGNLSWTPKNSLRTTIIGLTNNVTGNIVTMTVANTTPYINSQSITISGANISNSSASANINSQTFYVKVDANFSANSSVVGSGNVVLYTDTGLSTTANGAGLLSYTANTGTATAVLGSGSGGAVAGGSNRSVQFNDQGTSNGVAGFTFDKSTATLTVFSGNISTQNINATSLITAPVLISNIATGTAPLTVTSTTPVANLSVATAGSATTAGTVTTAAQGNITSVGILTGLTVGNVTANAVFGNGTIVLTSLGNITGGNLLSATYLTGTVTTAAQGNITSVGILTGLVVAGNITPNANITYNLGNNTNRFNDLYLANSTIYIGAQTISANTTSVSISGQLVATISGSATTAGTVTTAAQPNITSTGSLTTLTVTGSAFLSTTSGNVGIGTSSSTAKLSVNGGTSTSQIRWEVNNAGYVQEVSTNAAQSGYVYKSTDASYHVWKTSSSPAMTLDASQNLGIGVAPSAGRSLTVGKNVTGSVTSIGVQNNGQIQSDVINNYIGYYSYPSTVAAAFTIPSLYHYIAGGISTMGAGSAVTYQTGFLADSTLTGATNNYGFHGIIAAATGRYNLYMSGTADNYLAGKLILGISQGVVQNGADGYLGISGGSSVGLGGAIIAFGEAHATAPNEIHFRNSTNTTRMTILSGGNVGIANIAPTHTLSVTGTASVSGNITAGNVAATTFTGALTGNATTAGTVTTAAQGNITSVGTLTGLSVSGNITAGNVAATTFTGALTGAATTAGTVTTAAQGNITSVGTLTSLSVTGNITAGNVSATTFIGNATTAGTVTTAAQPNITSTGTLTSSSVTGNVNINTGTPVQYNTDGSIISGRLLGRYANRTGNINSYFADYNGTNSITSTDALRAGQLGRQLDSGIGNSNISMALGTNYGSKAAGLAFVSGTADDVLAIAINGTPLYLGNVNAVMLGYPTVGPRILVQDYALLDSAPNVITYIANTHSFNGNVNINNNNGNGNVNINTGTPVQYATDGSILSGRMLGRYANAAGLAANMFADYDGTNTITSMNDGLKVLSLGSSTFTNIGNSNISMALGTSYGSKAAGLAFVSGTYTDILRLTTGLEPLYTGNVNAVMLGYPTAGPRILVQDYALADSAANVITYIATTHDFNGNVTVDSLTFSDTYATGIRDLKAINSGQLAGLRNRIINGNMMVWGRGTFITNPANGSFLADRWFLVTTGTVPAVATQSTNVPNAQSLYSLLYNGSAGNTVISLAQRIESLNMYDMSGQIVTVSAWVYSSDSRTVTMDLVYPTATDNYTSYINLGSNVSEAETGWRKITYQYTIPAQQFGLQPSLTFGAVGAGISVGIAQVQIEIGSVNTKFEQRSYGLELSLCQRYFYKTYDQSLTPGAVGGSAGSIGGIATAGGLAVITGSFPVTMRTTPTVVYYNPVSGAVGTWMDGGATARAVSMTASGSSGVLTLCTVCAASSSLVGQLTASAEF